MTSQNKLPYNTVPHYIAAEYRGGRLNINQLRLLLWLRAIGTPYGIATTSLVDLKNDVFPDFDLKINTINSMLLKLRQKQHVFFEPRQGKTGTFEIRLNHWLAPHKVYITLDKFFPEPRQWVSAETEMAAESSYPQANSSEANQKSEEQNQKLQKARKQLAKDLSDTSERREIRSPHNEHETEHQLYTHGNTLKKPLKGTLTPVRDFQPRNGEQARCKEIADDVRDEYINPLLSVLRTDGLRIIEKAWGILKEDRRDGKRIEKSEAAYLMAIIKKLRENQ